MNDVKALEINLDALADIQTYRFNVKGMKCMSCVAKVDQAIRNVPGVIDVRVYLEREEAIFISDSYVEFRQIHKAIKNLGNEYAIQNSAHEPLASDFEITNANSASDKLNAEVGFIKTYLPVLLIFVYLTGIVLIQGALNNNWNTEDLMSNFMGGFFIIFSYFKLLNLKGFAQAYQAYDIIAKSIPMYGLVYPFIELALGIAFLIKFLPLYTNLFTFILMSISIIGVLQKVLSGNKVQCACLGTIFNLPMSAITIIEDGLMIIMSGWMLIGLLL